MRTSKKNKNQVRRVQGRLVATSTNFDEKKYVVATPSGSQVIIEGSRMTYNQIKQAALPILRKKEDNSLTREDLSARKVPVYQY